MWQLLGMSSSGCMPILIVFQLYFDSLEMLESNKSLSCQVIVLHSQQRGKYLSRTSGTESRGSNFFVKTPFNAN